MPMIFDLGFNLFSICPIFLLFFENIKKSCDCRIVRNGTVLSLLMLPHLAFFALDCPPMHVYAFGTFLA